MRESISLKLQPNHVWVEFGKMIYYTFKGEFPPPANYYFAASKGVGLKLQRLLTNPKRLREELIKNWDAHCKTGITDTEPVPLEGALLDHLKKFDFSISNTRPSCSSSVATRARSSILDASEPHPSQNGFPSMHRPMQYNRKRADTSNSSSRSIQRS